MSKKYTKQFYYENCKTIRKSVLNNWNEVYAETHLNNIDKEKILRAMKTLNIIDGGILIDRNLTIEEKTKLFKETGEKKETSI